MFKKILLGLLALLVLAILVGPFLVPVPELTDTVPAAQLADPDGEFIRVRDLNVYVKRAGSGTPAYLLLHGFGASLFTWREVMEPLADYGSVIAYDRPAFGLTDRPMSWDNWNPYGRQEQVDIALGLLDELGIPQVVLVGNSAGGTVAAEIARRAPERVLGLVLISPAIYTSGGMPGWARMFLSTPQMQHLGPLLTRSFRDAGRELGIRAWHDPDKLTDEIWAGYQLPLRADNWDRALWFFTSSGSASDGLVEVIAELKVPVIIVTGDDDRVVPTADSIRLAKDTAAEVEVFEACGHIAHEECPEQFLAMMARFRLNLPAAVGSD